jgi:hypothetical protein
MSYRLVDYTPTGKGYLSLLCDGKRVCDFFPFAERLVGQSAADQQSYETFVREQAQLITDTMNAVPEAETTG